ncbi:hypothetical protein [Desertivirga xinjiangensis]|uniref:hypothetical protein n=1 Tax=Desertivirga xinjiangensis TaxID=539206 RepID=UPI00210B1338|nr:hypothetical protein [Pedobacter xinjiangensis]
MNDILAQLISLCAHGNAFLQGRQIYTQYFKENTTYRFCGNVEFRGYRETFFTRREVQIGTSPEEWFDYLKQCRCSALTLDFEYSADQSLVKDYKSAGFVGGGGRWAIKAFYPKDLDFWFPLWDSTDENAKDQKIWGVRYYSLDIMKVALGYSESLQQVREQLYRVLDQVSEFAQQHNLEPWGAIFQEALFTLSSKTPQEDYYYHDLLPPDVYSKEAEQVLFSAAKANVFGGMGSWNDMGFGDDKVSARYEELSSLLYDTIVKAIQVSVNSIRG